MRDRAKYNARMRVYMRSYRAKQKQQLAELNKALDQIQKEKGEEPNCQN